MARSNYPIPYNTVMTSAFATTLIANTDRQRAPPKNAHYGKYSHHKQ